MLCTPKTTLFFAHEKRGQEAIYDMGVLDKNYSEVLVHNH